MEIKIIEEYHEKNSKITVKKKKQIGWTSKDHEDEIIKRKQENKMNKCKYFKKVSNQNDDNTLKKTISLYLTKEQVNELKQKLNDVQRERMQSIYGERRNKNDITIPLDEYEENITQVEVNNNYDDQIQ